MRGTEEIGKGVGQGAVVRGMNVAVEHPEADGCAADAQVIVVLVGGREASVEGDDTGVDRPGLTVVVRPLLRGKRQVEQLRDRLSRPGGRREDRSELRPPPSGSNNDLIGIRHQHTARTPGG